MLAPETQALFTPTEPLTLGGARGEVDARFGRASNYRLRGAPFEEKIPLAHTHR